MKSFKNRNKRGNQRERCAVPVDGKAGSKFSELLTVDISRGGLGLISSKAIPLNEKIAVQLDTDPDKEPVLVMGKVVWVHKMSLEDRYRVGMKFQKSFSSKKPGHESRIK